MKRFDYPTLKRAAADDLSRSSCDPRRLVLIHTGITSLGIILLAAADFFLNREIGATGGLSGLDQRALLSTVQTVLRFLYIVLLPFWTIGYTFVTLQLARKAPVNTESLLEGFRRWGVVLRLEFLMLILLAGVLFFGMQAGYFLFCATPFAAPLLAVAEQIMQAGEAVDIIALEEDMYQALMQVRVPLLCTTALVSLLFGAPIYYRFRLAKLYLMEYPEDGALRALTGSTRLMRGSYSAMIRLDLHYWWYHGLKLLIGLAGSAGAIISLTGVTLPVSADIAALISAAVFALSSLALALWQKNRISLAYVHAYDILQDPPDEPQPVPQNLPWNY